MHYTNQSTAGDVSATQRSIVPKTIKHAPRIIDTRNPKKNFYSKST